MGVHAESVERPQQDSSSAGVPACAPADLARTALGWPRRAFPQGRQSRETACQQNSGEGPGPRDL
eukprot:1717280-Alexandrium_andersonii.AAC.2